MTRTLLILAGIGNSGPEHWQSHWQRELPSAVKLEHRDWDAPDRFEWDADLRAALRSIDGEVTLVAHSLACLLVAHWAVQAAPNVTRALLVSVPDAEAPAFPAAAQHFDQVPMRPLPFRSAVVASTDDPYASAEHMQRCAQAWRSRFYSIGALGHINASSGLGSWPQGQQILSELER